MELIIKIRNTIFNTILSAYSTNTTDPSTSPYQNNNILITRLWPGQLIDEKEYGNAWTPTNPKGWMSATENLSTLANPVPEVNEWYNRSGRTVEEVYAFLLSSAKPALENKALEAARAIDSNPTADTAPLPPNIKAELSKQKIIETTLPDQTTIQTAYLTPEATNRKNLEIAHSNAAAAVLAHRFATEKKQSNTAARPTANKGTVQPDAQLEQKRMEAWNQLQALNDDTPSARESFYPFDTNNIFYKATQIFNRSTLQSLKNPGVSYHPAYTSPENWVDSTAAMNWPLLTIPIEDTTPNVNITITFSRVDINRPWLLASLFEVKEWKNSEGPGSFSNGTFVDNNGSLALIPQSMIVARDIVARYDDGSIVFRSTGLQVLAYVNKLTPFAPPM